MHKGIIERYFLSVIYPSFVYSSLFPTLESMIQNCCHPTVRGFNYLVTSYLFEPVFQNLTLK